jgi:trehalose 6-phosphate phosphatase
LHACAARLAGALAIISGRPLARLDAQFSPHRFPAAGLHGLERRNAAGETITTAALNGPLQVAARNLAQAVAGMPLTQLENKGGSVALHWRRAPAREAALRELAMRELERAGPGFRLLEGNCVIELLPEVASKGSAVHAFMREAPFRGRRPVFVGDDITDAEGIAIARAHGGYGIAVGTRIAGDYHLSGVRAVRQWLEGAHD